MIKIKVIILIYVLFFTNILVSQTVKINGFITAKADFEGIHVINKTSKTFTKTYDVGAFKIQAKLNDTLVFSSIQYTLEVIIISKKLLIRKHLWFI